MKTKFFFMLTVLVSVLFTSCNKYPDGPPLSLKSAKSRLAGNWSVTSFTVNGQDQFYSTYSGQEWTDCSYYVTYIEEYTINSLSWNIAESGTFSLSFTETDKIEDYNNTVYYCTPYYTIETSTNSTNGRWELISNNTKVQLNDFSGSGSTETYDITELRENEVKLTKTESGDKIEFILSK